MCVRVYVCVVIVFVLCVCAYASTSVCRKAPVRHLCLSKCGQQIARMRCAAFRIFELWRAAALLLGLRPVKVKRSGPSHGICGTKLERWTGFACCFAPLKMNDFMPHQYFSFSLFFSVTHCPTPIFPLPVHPNLSGLGTCRTW